MSKLPNKYDEIVADAVGRLLARAENSRGLTTEAIGPRVVKIVEKYLLRDTPEPARQELRAFIDEIRADDLCLIIACESGDEKAWEDLVGTFDATVRSAARKMSSNAEDADDLASSIWAELYGLRHDAEGNKKSKLAYFSGRGSLAGWLRAVVSQLAVDEYRKQSKFVQIEEQREFDNVLDDASQRSGNELVVPHGKDPEELLTDKHASADVTAALRKAIEDLEDEDRLILKLYYFDDLKLKDIAATFGYHEATASRKINRVQAEIRKSVERSLRRDRGWSESEVKNCLSDAAAQLGLSLEKLVTVWAVMVVLQDYLH